MYIYFKLRGDGLVHTHAYSHTHVHVYVQAGSNNYQKYHDRDRSGHSPSDRLATTFFITVRCSTYCGKLQYHCGTL